MAKSKWNTNNIGDQKSRIVIITGATSGLGKEATKQMALKNATVFMAVRNVQKAENVKSEILTQHPESDIRIKQLDLGSLESIKKFSEEVISEIDRLDILINNAGVMMCPYSTTEDGFEIQMGTNHLGPFALTAYLLPLLKKTPGSRIVNTSSAAHRQGNINFEDLNWKNRAYKTGRAYGDSKIANLYFTFELADKLKNDNNTPLVTAAHPGWTRTELQRHSGLFQFLNNFFSQKVEAGVLPTLRAAVDPDAQPGDYFGPSGFAEMQGSPKKVGSTQKSRDKQSAERLWELSEQLTNIKYT